MTMPNTGFLISFLIAAILVAALSILKDRERIGYLDKVYFVLFSALLFFEASRSHATALPLIVLSLPMIFSLARSLNTSGLTAHLGAMLILIGALCSYTQNILTDTPASKAWLPMIALGAFLLIIGALKSLTRLKGLKPLLALSTGLCAIFAILCFTLGGGATTAFTPALAFVTVSLIMSFKGRDKLSQSLLAAGACLMVPALVFQAGMLYWTEGTIARPSFCLFASAWFIALAGSHIKEKVGKRVLELTVALVFAVMLLSFLL